MKEDQNITEFKKIASMFKTGNILTDAQLQSVLKNIAVILSNYRSSTATMNDETKTIVLQLLSKINDIHEKNESKFKETVEQKNGEFSDTVDKQIATVQGMIDKANAIPAPENGKDADPADVVPLVMEEMKSAMIDMMPKNLKLDEPEDIVDKLTTLEDEDRLPVSAIEEKSLIDFIKNVIAQTFRGKVIPTVRLQNTNGGGVQSITSKDGSVTIVASGAKGKGVVDLSAPGGTGSGLTKETPSGLVNNSNVTFTVVHQPFFINVNGAIYNVGDGQYTSYNSGTITLANPVGTGGFIKSYY